MNFTRKGFTLLEVMIAIAFVGIALVAVIRTQGQGLRLSEEARFTSRAVFLARAVLSRTQAEEDLAPGTRSELFKEPLDYIKWEREVTQLPGLPGLYRVQVWVYRDGEEERSGITLTGFANREVQE